MSESTAKQTAHRDVRWRPARCWLGERPPPALWQTLLDEGSLTRQLIESSHGNFAVQRLSQSWQVPLPSERALLGLGSRRTALIREVALLCHDQAWVFARSVLPLATLEGDYRHLRQLQNASLGALIFREPGLGRSPFEIARLKGSSHYIHPHYRQQEYAWARRSRFTLQHKPLLVSEVFLQPFQA